MNQLDTILLASNFKIESDNLVHMGAYVAEAFGSAVTLIHVLDTRPSTESETERARNVINQKLAEAADALRQSGVAVNENILDEGVPFDRIIHHANRIQAKAIMIGCGTHWAAGEDRLGVTAERLVRFSQKPVWTVKVGLQPPFKNILSPVDFSEASKRSLRNGIDLARRLDSKLKVMHAIKPLTSYDIWAWDPDHAAEEMHAYEQRERNAFDGFLKQIDFTGVNWSKRCRLGEPDEEIVLSVREQKNDLLVMGAVGHTNVSTYDQRTR